MLFPPSGLGRRGTFLCLLGVVWIIQGIAVLVTAPLTSVDPTARFLFHETMPRWLRFGLWAVTGLIAIYYGSRRSIFDRVGFMALVLMPLVRATSFLYGFILYLLPVPPEGYSRGFLGFVSWASVALAVIVCAGWPEAELEE